MAKFMAKVVWTRTILKMSSVFIRSYPCSSVFQRFTVQKNAFAASSGSVMPVIFAFCSRCQK
jgi:hypothetical protein